MSTKTPNYGLIKPELTDPANITMMNTNWDTIDTKLSNHAGVISTTRDTLSAHRTDPSAHDDIRASVTQSLNDAKSYTDTKIAAIPSPDVSGQISTHNGDTSAHADIRNLISGKADKNHAHDNTYSPVSHSHTADSIGAVGKLELLSEYAWSGTNPTSSNSALLGTVKLTHDIIVVAIKGTISKTGGKSSVNLGGYYSDYYVNRILENTSDEYRYYTLFKSGYTYHLLHTNQANAPQSVPANCSFVVYNHTSENDKWYQTTFNGTIRIYGGSLL